MFQLIEKGNKLVIEQMVTTLSVVADAAGDLFLPYYNQFIPSLKFILANANDKKYRLLRGKTMECISFIGLAVGKETVSEFGHVMLDNHVGYCMYEQHICVHVIKIQ